MNRFLTRLGLLSTCVLLLAAGCNSQNPLSDLSQSRVDESACGLWQTEDEAVLLQIRKEPLSKNLPLTEFALVNMAEGKQTDVVRMVGFPTTIGDRNYFNLSVPSVMTNYLNLSSPIKDRLVLAQLATDAEIRKLFASIHGYGLVKYSVTEDFLYVFLPEEEYIAESIKAGEIKGSGSVIKDSAENVAAFFLTHDAQLFPDNLRICFKRLN